MIVTVDDKVEYYLQMYGWDRQFFLLTRDHTLEITTLGGGFDGGRIEIQGSLFFYANQVLYNNPIKNPDGVPDMFGRNYLDQLFIALCMQLHIFIVSNLPQMIFKSLTTRKEGDRYLVRVQYDDVDMEMEVEEMFHHFTKLLKEQNNE